MSTLTRLVLGAMGQLRPRPAFGEAAATIALPTAETRGGLPPMEALARRHSAREFAPDALPLSLLSSLLWAAYGVKRPDGGRTAPSALNAQEIDGYVALPSGACRYDAAADALSLVAASDLRRVTGYHGFVDEAPRDLVYVADHARMGLVPVGAARRLRVGCRRRNRAERVPVCRRQRPRYRDSRLDRSRRDGRRDGTHARSAGSVVTDRRLLHVPRGAMTKGWGSRLIRPRQPPARAP